MLLSVSKVWKSYDPDTVLNGVSFRIAAREKVALVGRNGTGKTTLLKIISGAEQPDRGEAQLARGTRVGYLSQISPVPQNMTVLACAQMSIEPRVQLAHRLRELEQLLESGAATPDDLEEYGLVHERFLENEGYAIERETEVVLLRLGFTKEQFGQFTDVLSGGERTRLALARLLLDQPDLLILDEPTNHLDLEATAWLESWVRGYHGAVLVVSHDRTFLDTTAERYLLLQNGTTTEYPGPYEKFQLLRQAAADSQAAVAKKQDREIAKMDEFVRRFMNSQRTAQARGRLKLMNRLIASKVDAPTSEKGMTGGFQKPNRSGDLVLQLKGGTKQFGEKVLFKNFSWTVRRGEHWGVIGENGSGKTTLIRCCLGVDPLDQGSCDLGTNIEIGYFSQDSSDLDPRQTPLEAIVDLVGDKIQAARDLLGRFLITGEDAFRPISTFSGGERNKLSLARLVALQPNALVLDEPTNHLDLDSREALVGLLQEFEGTLILISHDRWLLSHCTNKMLDITSAGITAYHDSYQEYKQSKKTDSTKAVEVKVERIQQKKMSPRDLSKAIEKHEKLVTAMEDEVSAEAARLKRIEEQLEAPEEGELMQLIGRHTTQLKTCEQTVQRWTELTTELEELRDQQIRK